MAGPLVVMVKMTKFRIEALTEEHSPQIAKVFADDGGYALRVLGRASTSADVHDLSHLVPPSADPAQKHTMGLWDGFRLLGVADLIEDWPELGYRLTGEQTCWNSPTGTPHEALVMENKSC